MSHVKQRRSASRTSLLLATGVAALAMVASTAPAADKARPEIDGVWLGVSGTVGVGGMPASKLTPAGKQAAAEFQATYGPDVPEAGSYCVHSGMPSMMTASAGYPLEIISNGKQINIGVETGSTRRIFMDGRPHPEDRPHTSVGHSVGRWEGDVLVIETKLLAERVDSRIISDEARIVERIYLKDDTGERRRSFAENMEIQRNGKMLVDEITVIDPKFYVEPIKLVGEFRRAPDTAVLEYDCGREFWEAALEQKLHEKQQQAKK
jgi:hypothetical protein